MDGLDPEVMHDQLEGVLRNEIKLLLKKYVREEDYFTLATLNERITTFDYGPPDISNNPSAKKPQALSTGILTGCAGAGPHNSAKQRFA